MHGRHGGVPTGLGFIHPRKKFQRVKTRRAMHLAPGGEGREQAGDQTVDVKQRHDVQTAIARCKTQGIAHVARGRADIALRQRNNFRPRCGAGRMQDQRDIVTARGAGIRCLTILRGTQRKISRCAICIG